MPKSEESEVVIFTLKYLPSVVRGDLGMNSQHLRYLQAALKSNHSSQILIISMTADLGKTPKK